MPRSDVGGSGPPPLEPPLVFSIQRAPKNLQFAGKRNLKFISAVLVMVMTGVVCVCVREMGIYIGIYHGCCGYMEERKGWSCDDKNAPSGI